MLSFALSLTAHGTVLAWMASTPMRADPPRVAQVGQMPQGERRPVTVTMVMKMSNLAQPGRSKPTDRVAQPSDTPPSETSDTKIDKPIAEPTAAEQSTASPSAENDPPPQQTADTSRPSNAEAGSTTRQASANDQLAHLPPPDVHAPPNASDREQDHAIAQPIADQKLLQEMLAIARQADKPIPPMPVQHPKSETQPLPLPLPSLTRSADASSPTDQSPGNPDAAPIGKPVDKPVDAPDPASTSASAADREPTPQDSPGTNPGTPAAVTANADPPTTPDTDASAALAVVYDEDSVDEPIAFKHMARPEPTSVSRRMGDAGTIRILVKVDADGTLLGHEVLDDADQPRLLAVALKALEQSTFLPAQREGQPVRSTRVIEYRF